LRTSAAGSAAREPDLCHLPQSGHGRIHRGTEDDLHGDAAVLHPTLAELGRQVVVVNTRRPS
jgi:hypothetical protein